MAMDLQKVKRHPFINHSPSKDLSSLSENDNDGQALRVEASFTSFNEQCAGQASAAQLFNAPLKQMRCSG